MPVEILQRSIAPTIIPTFGSIGRISTTTEPLEPEHSLLELAPDLKLNPYLKEAGYDVRMEIGRLFKDINIALAEGKSLSEAVNIATGELEINIRSYNLEIIKQKPVLPHLNRFDEKNSKLRLVGNNGEPVVNSITAKERNGAVLQASRSIEDFLLLAQDNSVAVLMNPSGWNGFTDEYGREALPHLNAETMVFWKDSGGVLKGLTLVTDLSEDQARQVMVGLGVSERATGDSEREKLADIVRNPALISFPGLAINPFEYVLDKMLAIRGVDDIRLKQRDGSVEARTIDEVRESIRRFDELLSFTEEEERLVMQPKQFILEEAQRLGESAVQQGIVHKIEKAILLLAREQLKRNEVYAKTVIPAFSSVIPAQVEIHTNYKEDDFSPEVMFLKSRGGCPASVAARILSGVSLGQNIGGTVYFGFGGEASKKGTCIICGEVNYCTKTCYKCNGVLV